MIWKWAKRIGFVFTALLAAVTLFGQGAKFFRHDLVGQIDGNAFVLPPQLDDFYNNLTKELDADTFVPRVLADEHFNYRAGYTVKGISDSQKEDLVRGIVRLLPSRLEIVIPYDFKNIKSYWTGTITNSGSAQITAVQLYLEGTKFALLTRDDNSKTTQSTDNLVNIGDLRAKEKVGVSVWSTYSLDYYQSFARDIRLTHHLGIGKLTIPRRVTGILASLDEHSLFIYLIGWIVLVIVVAIGAAALQSRQDEPSQQEEPPPDR